MTQTSEHRRLVRIAGAMNVRARRAGAYGVISAVELAAKPPECWHCGIEFESGQGTFDHLIALNKGGVNQSFNIVRCCLSCNRRKFDKTPAQFEEHQQLVSTCIVCGQAFHPRWAEWQAGRARTCSRSCAAKRRWA
jgi:5-methylcytosine-specific restriction endonuclease McrA